MRPLRLEIEGFTVYKRPQIIDFEKLSFFVIQGKTGAGKTSIVDAITYALYGKVPRYGDARDASARVLSKGSNRLRVSLEFSVGGRKYRIERFYRHKPKESILRVEEEGRKLNLKKAEVERWVKKVTGLDYRTFTKVILLPQGEFDKFLKPKEPKERREILIDLLDLKVFEKMREIASDTCKQLEGELNALRSEMESLKGLREGVLEELEREKNREEKRIEELRRREREMEELLRKAMERDRLKEELKNVSESLRSLESKRKEVEQLKDRIEKASKVLPYLPYLERLEGTEKELRDLRIEKERLLKSRMELLGEMENVKAEKDKVEEEFRRLPALREDLQATVRDLERLEEAKEELTVIESVERQITEKEEELAEVERTYRECEEKLSRGERLMEEVKRELQLLDYKEEEHETLIKKVERKRTLLRHLNRLREIERSIEEKTEERDILSKELDVKMEELRKKEEELKEAGIRVHAHRIRSVLREGDRCPVCGGIFEGGEFEEEDTDLQSLSTRVEELRSEVLQIEKKLSSLEAEIAALKREKSSLESEIDKEGDLLEESVEDRLREMEERRRRKKELEEKLGNFQDRYRQLMKEREKALMELEGLRGEINSLKKLLEEKKGRVARLTVGIPGLEEIEDEISRLRTKRKDIELRIREVEKSRDKFKAYWEELYRKLVALDTKLKEIEALLERKEMERRKSIDKLVPIFEELGDIDRIREFALPEEEINSMKNEVEEFYRKMEVLEEKKRDILLRLENMSGIGPSEHIDRKLLSLKEEIERSLKRIGEIRSEIEQKRELLERKGKLEKRVAELEGELLLYSKLKDDLRSDRLQEFASNLMLKRIVERASDYLLNFTDTYEFLVDAKGDLAVLDRTQGVERDVKSLSGGETFLASLSLALGVSDVLSANAHLESLFIDEGFGSLDEDTRERVSDILETLKQRINRMVGIISHIPDLAERFHQRIIVRKHGDFSTVEVVW